MWDNPRQLNAVANSLIALACVAFAYASLQALLRSPLFPLREVLVQGQPVNAQRAEIEAALDGVGGNFFAADLAAVRARLEQVPWVRRVDVRRVWPDRLQVALEEHVVFARWSQEAGDAASRSLVNTFGEPFAAPIEAALAARLPFFAGPAGSESDVTRRYRRFAAALAPLGDRPERVLLSARHAWQLRLASGLVLELGRDGAEAVEVRLARFVEAWPETLGALGRRAEHVDLRYPNGFALRVAGWKS
jgi:cell division protein FtsQ